MRLALAQMKNDGTIKSNLRKSIEYIYKAAEIDAELERQDLFEMQKYSKEKLLEILSEYEI